MINVDIEPADILAVKGSGWLSRMILKATGGPVSHVGLLLTDKPPLVIEALSRVMTRPLHISIEKRTAAYILQPLKLTPEQRVAIVEAACTMSADAYGWGKIALQGLDALSRSGWFTKHLTFTTMPICSWLVAKGYSSQGLHFDVPDNSATPKDIYEFAVKNQDLYRIVQIL